MSKNARNIKLQTPGNEPKPEQMPPQKEVEATQVGVVKPEPVKLPKQTEINPDEIERAVLTDEGWIVPSKLGTPPAK